MENVENNITNLEKNLWYLEEKSNAYVLNYQENNTYIENIVNNNSGWYKDIFEKYFRINIV